MWQLQGGRVVMKIAANTLYHSQAETTQGLQRKTKTKKSVAAPMTHDHVGAKVPQVPYEDDTRHP